METLDQLTKTFGKPPGTGGSGGGPNKNLYNTPEPQAIGGFNSTVVYGSNVQIAIPVNFQLAFGSNLQICINPSAFKTLYGDGAVMAPPSLNALLGGGMGGNMQLTMGTSANVVMGQSFDINLGPNRIQIDVHNKEAIQAAIKPLGTAIWVSTAVVLLAYLAIPDDDGRAMLLMAFQMVMQLLLAMLMDLQAMYNIANQVLKDAIDKAFGWDSVNDHRNAQGIAATFKTPTTAWVENVAALSTIMLPFLLESIGEMVLDHSS